MPETYHETLHGVEVKYQKIYDIPYYVFPCPKDFKKYHTAQGITPPAIVQDWRDGVKGDWVLTDDGAVCQILYNSAIQSKAAYQKPECKWVRTIVGSFINSFMVMDSDFEKHMNRYTFSTKIKNLCKKDMLISRKNATRKEKIFCQVVAVQQNVTLERLTAIYRGIFKDVKPKNAEFRVLELLGNERIMKHIRDLIDESAKKLKIDPDFILGNIKDLAEDSRREDVRLSANVQLGKYIGMENTKDDNPGTAGFAGTLEVHEDFEELERGGQSELPESSVVEPEPTKENPFSAD